MDPYKTLGIKKDASQDEIKKAFRERALKHHPDKGGDEEKFKQINEAYSMISDPHKRGHYDASRDRPGFDFGFSTGGFPFGDMFGEIFGRQEKKKSRPTRDEDIVFNVNLSLRQVKQGMRQKIDFERVVACRPCDGEGGEGKRPCGPCGGQGTTVIQPNAYTYQQKTCYYCNGSGTVFTSVCGGCNGVGLKKVRDSVVVLIKQI